VPVVIILQIQKVYTLFEERNKEKTPSPAGTMGPNKSQLYKENIKLNENFKSHYAHL